MTDRTDGDDPLILSALNDWLYCPRRCAMHRIDGLWQANAHTIAGDLAHAAADQPGYRQYLDSAGECLRIERALPLFSRALNLVGKADIVEFHQRADGAEIPMPVDYKLGKRRRWDNNEAQLCAQALCLEEMFDVAVPAGAIYHVAARRRQPVDFTAALRELTHRAIANLRRLLTDRQIPPAVLKPQCDGCSLRETCMPEITQTSASLDGAYDQLFKVA